MSFLVGFSRSGVALRSVQNDCPKLEMCFSRADVGSRPGKARLVVQSATSDLDLRD